MSATRLVHAREARLAAMLACWVAAACGDGGSAATGDASGASDAGADAGDAGEAWQLVFEGLDGALMSVAGTRADDVWTAGADTRDGEGALVLHFDGKRWRRVPTGVEADLWWVHALGERDVFIGGARGTIVHWDGDAFERMDTPGDSTVYGIWGASSDDVWAVGGDPDASPGFVWHFDGSAWDDWTDRLPKAAQGPPIFKAWGRAADDVWMVGIGGLAVHWNGTEFEAGDSGSERMLFTVHGVADGQPAFVAVGGYGDAVIVEHDGDGTAWHNATPDPPLPQLFGVCMIGPNDGYAVGLDGAVARRRGSAWNLLDIGMELFDPFHSVWVDPDGGVWAAGGDVMSPVPRDGMLLHSGEEISDAIE